MNKPNIIPVETISQKIFIMRGVKVMLDADLAELYQVPTKRLNEQIKRNHSRFPEDFMFQLTKEEFMNLRSQFATSSWGGHRYEPYAFTEHGVAMLSSVLKSQRAIEMNIFIIRAFIKLRELLATNTELALKIEKLEREQQKQGEHISVIHDMLKRLIAEPVKPKGRLGFKAS